MWYEVKSPICDCFAGTGGKRKKEMPQPSVIVKEKKKKGPAPKLNGNEVCLICNDKASGFHYNTLSCEGCKGWFSLQMLCCLRVFFIQPTQWYRQKYNFVLRSKISSSMGNSASFCNIFVLSLLAGPNLVLVSISCHSFQFWWLSLKNYEDFCWKWTDRSRSWSDLLHILRFLSFAHFVYPLNHGTEGLVPHHDSNFAIVRGGFGVRIL